MANKYTRYTVIEFEKLVDELKDDPNALIQIDDTLLNRKYRKRNVLLTKKPTHCLRP